MKTSEKAKPINEKRADAGAGTDKNVRDAESPYLPTDYEQRLSAASAILARVALRIAGGATDGSAGNPSVPQTVSEACDTAMSAPATATAGLSANPSAMPDGPAGETPPPSLSGLPEGRQDSADPTIDEAEGEMEVWAA